VTFRDDQGLSTRFMQGFAPEERPDLVVSLARSLIRFLLSEEVKPGDRLPSERQLAEITGVGRSAVREALKALSLLGIVQVRQGDGTYLKRAESTLLPDVIEWGLLLGERKIRDIIEVRAELEIVGARWAASRRTDADIARLKAEVETMAASSHDLDTFRKGDVGFHLALAKATHNEILISMLSSMHSLLDVWSRRTLQGIADLSGFYEEHRAVFQEILRGEPEAAAHAMEAHMRAALERLRVTLPPERASEDAIA
jgi:GntR family transcriptional regulator, transcriptional repressor for pyruvate dehydrogenase complex